MITVKLLKCTVVVYLPPRCPFRIAEHPLLTSLEEERSHQCKIAWGECFTKSYWNGRKQQLIILLTEFQTGKKHKVDSFSATYKVLLLPATEPGILFSSKNKFINEQRRILSNSVSKQAPTLLGTSLKILKYSKDKLTTGTSESSQSYIVVISV